jgi:hypothetical protein
MQTLIRKIKQLEVGGFLMRLVIVCVIFFLMSPLVTSEALPGDQPVQPIKVKAEIQKVELMPCAQTDNECKVFTVKFIEGDRKDQEVDIEYDTNQSFPIEYGAGDTVFVDILELSEDYSEYTITGVV